MVVHRTFNNSHCPKYFNYAGLQIDTSATELPSAYIGITTKMQGDSLVVSEIDWKSPGWNAGLRRKDQILEINGAKANAATFNKLMATVKTGDLVQFLVSNKGSKRELKATIGKQKIKNYAVTPVPNPTTLQQQILKSWLRE